VRLDLVELLERAIHVDGIELVGRHAVSQQRVFEIVDGMVTHAARPRETLHVPELRPALRLLAWREHVGAIGENG